MRIPGIPYVQGRNAYSDADGTKYGIAIHNTSNDATAEGEASYATRRTDGVSAHFYCDNNSVVQSLDTAVRAGHAGSGNGNNHAVAVEITGTNDKSRQWWLDNVAWDLLGRVLAQVCRHYGIAVRRASIAEMRDNPKVRAFYGHDDMRRAWGGTTHTDPGGSFPWDRLFQAVNAALGQGASMAGEYSPDTACAIAFGGTSAGRVKGTGVPWDDALDTFNLKAVEERLDTKIEAAQAVLADGQVKLAEGVAAVLAAVAELRELVDGAGGVDEAVVVAALESPAGQAAIVAAANAAEDS